MVLGLSNYFNSSQYNFINSSSLIKGSLSYGIEAITSTARTSVESLLSRSFTPMGMGTAVAGTLAVLWVGKKVYDHMQALPTPQQSIPTSQQEDQLQALPKPQQEDIDPPLQALPKPQQEDIDPPLQALPKPQQEDIDRAVWNFLQPYMSGTASESERLNRKPLIQVLKEKYSLTPESVNWAYQAYLKSGILGLYQHRDETAFQRAQSEDPEIDQNMSLQYRPILKWESREFKLFLEAILTELPKDFPTEKSLDTDTLLDHIETMLNLVNQERKDLSKYIKQHKPQGDNSREHYAMNSQMLFDHLNKTQTKFLVSLPEELTTLLKGLEASEATGIEVKYRAFFYQPSLPKDKKELKSNPAFQDLLASVEALNLTEREKRAFAGNVTTILANQSGIKVKSLD